MTEAAHDAVMTQDSLRILLVEDSTGEAILFRRALKARNPAIEVTHALNGDDALGLLIDDDAQAFDLVFLDLNLPTISGMDVLKSLKSQVTVQSIPVVVLSSSDADSDVNEAYRNFASAYMVKPIDPEGYTKLAAFIDECWFGMIRMPTAAGARR
jgi:two-component system, chemotaxis family, response regulator Rcp1